MSKFSEAIDCNEISDSIPSKIGRKRLMDVLLKEETETNLQRPYETILRKIDLNLIFNVEFGGKYEKRNYNGFADFLEEQSAKMVGENRLGDIIEPKKMVDQLLSHSEAKEVREDENLEALVNLISFIAYNYMDALDMDGMYDDSIKVLAIDSKTKIIKWVLKITSINGIQRGYDVINLADDKCFFKFKS